MIIPFYKYQGSGNDFIIIDNRKSFFTKDKNLIIKLCSNKFGIGADGLMTINNKKGYDFQMNYFNSNGLESTMCGNGGRCIVALANYLGIIKDKTNFFAIDGEHSAKIIEVYKNCATVSLKMRDVTNITVGKDYFIINTGSPHYVIFVKDLEHYDVYNEGKKIRYNDEFSTEGINVDFVEMNNKHLFVRTYERGVENETLSCGTGVTASALAAAIKIGKDNINSFNIRTLGGSLKVDFKKNNNTFSEIWLQGPAAFVFKGEIETLH